MVIDWVCRTLCFVIRFVSGAGKKKQAKAKEDAMKLISWNVNGLRACLKKGFAETFRRWTPTSSACRKPRCSPARRILPPKATPSTSTAPTKRAIPAPPYGAKAPLSVQYGMAQDLHNHEGRAITLEYPDFYLVNCYAPNSQNELARLDYRMQWEDDLRATCRSWTRESR